MMIDSASAGFCLTCCRGIDSTLTRRDEERPALDPRNGSDQVDRPGSSTWYTPPAHVRRCGSGPADRRERTRNRSGAAGSAGAAGADTKHRPGSGWSVSRRPARTAGRGGVDGKHRMAALTKWVGKSSRWSSGLSSSAPAAQERDRAAVLLDGSRGRDRRLPRLGAGTRAAGGPAGGTARRDRIAANGVGTRPAAVGDDWCRPLST